MSVYKPTGSPYWHSDFQFQGRRFHGSTGTTSKRKAQQVEAQRRSEAALGAGRRRSMTLDTACGRYYREVAEHQPSVGTTFYQLGNLLDGLGADALLSQITDNEIAEYISHRRSKVSNASVNRETQLLRRVYRRADKTWKADIGEMPDWSSLKLVEPEGRTRELRADEEIRLFAHLREDMHPLVRFCLLTGVRLMNAARLTWSQVDLENREIIFRTKSKRPGGDLHVLPITRAMLVLLAEQRGLHPIYCFTYACKRSRGQRRKGERYPFSKSGWRKDWARALEAASIEDFRFHDTRHTAATRTLRASKNLKAVQRMLGHSDITMTARYAHALKDDVLAAMEAAESRNSPEVDVVSGDNTLKGHANS